MKEGVKMTEESYSLSYLLLKHKVGVSAVEFNKLMSIVGYIEKRERISRTTGEVKYFNAFKGKGLMFGRNERNLYTKDATSCAYYPSKFPDLLVRLKLN